MKRSTRAKTQNSTVALLWDESFLWGLMAYKKLRSLGLSFDLIRSEDIRKGCLKKYKMLFVPGGWASNKLKALGTEGVKEIKGFVHEGGNYFGICGGAGLATTEGLGLLNIKRKTTEERVPSFSGRIYLNIKKHPIWNNLQSSARLNPIFYAWWPSQFLIDCKDIKILATFGEALPDAFSSDLCIGDVIKNCGWNELEKMYKINLDPLKLKNDPAVLEGRFGKGKVILSLIHFDTPECENGSEVLRNIWEYLSDGIEDQKCKRTVQTVFYRTSEPQNFPSDLFLHPCTEIINFGLRNFLWFWRTPMLLQWRRGVRGLEYCTLYVMIKELAELERQNIKAQTTLGKNIFSYKDYRSTRLLHRFSIFKEKAMHLLMLERQAMQRGMITYEHSDTPEIQSLRIELFGNSKSHGGLFKQIIDGIDLFLFESLVSKLNFSIDNNN